jgi:hypothetical protein
MARFAGKPTQKKVEMGKKAKLGTNGRPMSSRKERKRLRRVQKP